MSVSPTTPNPGTAESTTADTGNHPARLYQALAAGVIGAILSVGVAFATSTGATPSPNHPISLTPVASPASASTFGPDCHWRPYGWLCSAGPAPAGRLIDPFGVQVAR
jgi:hypothetical protein